MNERYFLFFFLTLAFNFNPLSSEAPWGQDIDLVYGKPISPPTSSYIVGADTLIHFHQQVISPADGPRSHYIPSSSSYALQAIRRYGLIQGFLMGCDRLLRENDEDWIYPHITTRDGDVLKLDPIK